MLLFVLLFYIRGGSLRAKAKKDENAHHSLLLKSKTNKKSSKDKFVTV